MKGVKDIFNKTKKEAEEIFEDDEKVYETVDEASEKAEKHKNAISKVWHQLQLMLSLLRDYSSGSYRDVSKSQLILMLAGIIYFILPVDFAPDFIPGIGYIDDAFVISVIARQFIYLLEDYEEWKNSEFIEVETE
ncbi:MAG: DUF1232 domain-containing protein [Chlorobi bacterium]|nr:DUF1232 domain-containing protein [Chlorobiota bacterium]